MNDSPSHQNRPPIVDISATTTGGAPLVLNDCWKKIGVSGDGSCVELEKHIHCRNCPVYSHAATQLLNRSLPAEYRRQQSDHFAQPKYVSSLGKLSVVVFRVGVEWLALPTHVFQEIAEFRPIHSLPHRRHGLIAGLVNLRGELLICVSLARLLGMENTQPHLKKSHTAYDRLVVAAWNNQRFVFPVDEAHGIQRLQPEHVQAPPATIARSAAAYTSGIFSWHPPSQSSGATGDKTVGLLDTESLFNALNRSLA